MNNLKLVKKIKRKKSIKAKVMGDAARPRLSVFRSNINIYAQIINDVTGKTLVSVSSLKSKSGIKSEIAKKVGQELAKKAVAKKISQVRFDRNANKYHGRVKALAEGAREGGLIF